MIRIGRTRWSYATGQLQRFHEGRWWEVMAEQKAAAATEAVRVEEFYEGQKRAQEERQRNGG